MKTFGKLFATMLTVTVAVAHAEEAPLEASEEAFAKRETFGKWRVAVGAAFNAGVKADIGRPNMPLPAPTTVSTTTTTKEEALRNAQAHQYDEGGYIGGDVDGAWGTTDWELPGSTYNNVDTFTLHNAYRGAGGYAGSSAWNDNSSSEMQYGLSFEVSRELWIHDEEDEHRWGVDLAFAFSYFFSRDIYRANGYSSYVQQGPDGSYVTTVHDTHNTMYDYNNYGDNAYEGHPYSGMYGHGATADGFSPMLWWSDVGQPQDTGSSGGAISYNKYSASGDYQELEMLLMLRPWYEITDWWRVYAEIGLGVSWGNFESDFYGSGLDYSEDFSQWDCYGVAGLGTMFRYKMIDLSVDFLGRFLRDDMDVDGTYAKGSIQRSDWGFRVMVGVDF